MEIVQFDLNKYIRRNIFPSRTVLVFPPFNGFRRFLIHKLIEDHFSSSEVAAFSIGQDISRRIVVCYKGLIREVQNKGKPGYLSQKSEPSMIEKERQSRSKVTPSAAVYRPPAARIAESRRNMDDTRPPDSKRNRVRRPDQQMYVPRPKRASYGHDHPTSLNQYSSKTGFENGSFEKENTSMQSKCEELQYSTFSKFTCGKNNLQLLGNLSCSLETCKVEGTLASKLNVNVIPVLKREKEEPDSITEIKRPNDFPNFSSLSKTSPEISLCDKEKRKGVSTESVSKSEATTGESEMQSDCDLSTSESTDSKNVDEILHHTENVTNNESGNKNESNDEITITNRDSLMSKQNKVTKTKMSYDVERENSSSDSIDNLENENSDIAKLQHNCSRTEGMETISISSDSRGYEPDSCTSCSNNSRSSDSSIDSEVLQSHCGHKSDENMDIENSVDSTKTNLSNSQISNAQDQNLKNRRIFPNLPVSDVLIISDSISSDYISSDDSNKILTGHEPKLSSIKGKTKKTCNSKEKSNSSVKENKSINPNEYDWESLYDDSGDCLVPDLMEELTNSVGKVRVTSVDSDYRPYQSIEERTGDGECIIEIYDFPAEFKTTDLFNIFAAYRNKNFQIKWVDDTHALGVFPSPIMADEVLACTLPFVKTRPLRLGIAESRNKAKALVLPPLPSLERPKTCTALARRLVSGALGLRLPTSSQEREKEKQVLKEAREKRRLEAKQREAAWDGTLTSSNCI